jgi:hypothetical protein
MSQQADKKSYYYMKTYIKKSKSGKRYHTGKFSYAIDIIGFENEVDGTISWRLEPKDMEQMKQQQEARQGNHPYSPKQYEAVKGPQPQKGYLPKTEQKPPYKDFTKPNSYTPPNDGAPWPDQDDEIPF